MNIEVRNVGFVNKGAELMLYAIMEKVSESIPDAKYVMKPSNYAPYSKMLNLGINKKIDVNMPKIDQLLSTILTKGARERYDLVLDTEINVVLDASGFYYGDQWGPKNAEIAERKISRWKQQGTKVILLPQAFGPFTTKRIRDSMISIIEKADLIYARDPISYQNLNELVINRENIGLCPDFTNILDGKTPNYFNNKNNDFCIVPNNKMLTHTSSEVSNSYIHFLVNCITNVIEIGYKPFLLIHETKQDLSIAHRVNELLPECVNIIEENDPIKVKGIIGDCKGSVGSRFHGLVSALSQGVISIGTGWTHKYQMLFDSYSIPEGIVSPLIRPHDLSNKIEVFFNSATVEEKRSVLLRASKKQKEQVNLMWEQVLGTIL